MLLRVSSDSLNGYCLECDLIFGLVREGDGKIKCPQCKIQFMRDGMR